MHRQGSGRRLPSPHNKAAGLRSSAGDLLGTGYRDLELAEVTGGIIPGRSSLSRTSDGLWALLGTALSLTCAGLLLKLFCWQRPAPQESLLQVEAVPVEMVVLNLWSKQVWASRVLVAHENRCHQRP